MNSSSLTTILGEFEKWNEIFFTMSEVLSRRKFMALLTSSLQSWSATMHSSWFFPVTSISWEKEQKHWRCHNNSWWWMSFNTRCKWPYYTFDNLETHILIQMIRSQKVHDNTWHRWSKMSFSCVQRCKMWPRTGSLAQNPRQGSVHCLENTLSAPHLVNFVLKVSIILVIDHLGKPDLLSSSLQNRDHWVKWWKIKQKLYCDYVTWMKDQKRSLYNVCNAVWLQWHCHSCAYTGVLFPNFYLRVLSLHFFSMFRWLWLLTWICFCGCEVWVAAGNAFSRGPRALSLPSELIIYSIYKTLYVQNRKICKGNKAYGWYHSSFQQFLNPQIMCNTLPFRSFTMSL